jgi:hypothetical protein
LLQEVAVVYLRDATMDSTDGEDMAAEDGVAMVGDQCSLQMKTALIPIAFILTVLTTMLQLLHFARTAAAMKLMPII